MKKPIKLNRCEEIISSSYDPTNSTNELCLTICYTDKQDWAQCFGSVNCMKGIYPMQLDYNYDVQKLTRLTPKILLLKPGI